jgi:hypothetical protein
MLIHVVKRVLSAIAIGALAAVAVAGVYTESARAPDQS